MTSSLKFGVGAVLALACVGAHAAGIVVVVTDRVGAPVADAVVSVEPAAGRAPPMSRARPMEIEQKDRRFTPAVSVAQVGQAISFPNNDSVRHHVYSLSQAKLFEIKLYSGVPANPVVFDKPGTIVLGCNIHDRMVAWIRVVDTPWFGKTDERGQVRIDGFPDGAYVVRGWHPGLPNLDVAAELPVTVKGAGSALLRLDLKAGGH
jgi:plastocyanin